MNNNINTLVDREIARRIKKGALIELPRICYNNKLDFYTVEWIEPGCNTVTSTVYMNKSDALAKLEQLKEGKNEK